MSSIRMWSGQSFPSAGQQLIIGILSSFLTQFKSYHDGEFLENSSNDPLGTKIHCYITPVNCQIIFNYFDNSCQVLLKT